MTPSHRHSRRRPVALLAVAGTVIAAGATALVSPALGTAVPGTSTRSSAPVAFASALLPGLTNPAGWHLTDGGALDPAQVIDVSMDIARPDPAGEAAAERAIYTPGSPSFHRFFTPSTFAAQFGVAKATEDEAVSYLTAHGLTVVETSAAGDHIGVKGSVADVEATFATSIRSYTTDKGVSFFANTTAPMVPGDLDVVSVLGLETWHRAHLPSKQTRITPQQDTCTGGVCIGDTTPQDLWSIYDQPTAYTGKGQKVAIFGEGAYNYVISDLQHFESDNKLPSRSVAAGTVKVITTDGPDDGTNYNSMDGDVEWQIDTQSSTGMAPDADQLDMYWGTSLTDASTLQTMDTWSNDADAPKQADASYGECEAMVGDPGTLPIPSPADPTGTGLVYVGNPFESLAYEKSYEKGLTQAVMEGRTLFNSSGDSGSSCGQLPIDGNGVANDGDPTVAYPSSSQNVVSVGGTVLYTTGATPNTRSTEYGWTYSGGGTSALIPEPAYQDKIPAVDGLCMGSFTDASATTSVTTCRADPDISAQSGDVASNGYTIYADGSDTSGGGTSLSSPLSDGMWARVQSGAGGNAGFANPSFYRYCNDFFDVGAIGGADTMPSSNGVYTTDTGWDYVTGLGTMDVAELIRDISADAPDQTCAAGTLPTTGLGAAPSSSAAPSTTPTSGSPSTSPSASGSAAPTSSAPGTAAPTSSAPGSAAPSSASPSTSTKPGSTPTAGTGGTPADYRTTTLRVGGRGPVKPTQKRVYSLRLFVDPGAGAAPSLSGRLIGIYVDGKLKAHLVTAPNGTTTYALKFALGNHVVTAVFYGTPDLRKATSPGQKVHSAY